MAQQVECKEFNEFKTEVNILIDKLKKDAEEFYIKENKDAGVRLRKGYKKIKQYVHDVWNQSLPKNTK